MIYQHEIIDKNNESKKFRSQHNLLAFHQSTE
jgi:hypothetical protein